MSRVSPARSERFRVYLTTEEFPLAMPRPGTALQAESESSAYWRRQSTNFNRLFAEGASPHTQKGFTLSSVERPTSFKTYVSFLTLRPASDLPELIPAHGQAVGKSSQRTTKIFLSADRRPRLGGRYSHCRNGDQPAAQLHSRWGATPSTASVLGDAASTAFTDAVEDSGQQTNISKSKARVRVGELNALTVGL